MQKPEVVAVQKIFERMKSFNTGRGLFEEMSEMGHEEVVYCYDKPTGLKAIIAIHNTVLGPALGGTRMWDYQSEGEALIDALRLARGMTLKAALSGLDLGGGKAVIMGDASSMKTEALMRRFGRFVDSLGGKYVTAEDVNMTEEDMENIAKETKYVTGQSENAGGAGDPSPHTAYGVYQGMRAACKKAYGDDRLEGKKILVQGVGHVGTYLLEYLKKEGAELYVTDLFEEKVRTAVDRFGAVPVKPGDAYELEMDIYSPCGLGAVLNDETIPKLKCRVIAGAANNQLLDDKLHGRMLLEYGILYAPDFLVNAGGLINVGLEYLGIWEPGVVRQKVERIYDTTIEILNQSQEKNISTQEAAIEAAMWRIEKAKNPKAAFRN